MKKKKSVKRTKRTFRISRRKKNREKIKPKIAFSGPSEILNKVVRIYTSEDCKYCEKTKNFFRKNNIKFEEVKLEDDPSFNEYSNKYGKLGIPVMEIGERTIVGFNKDLLKKIFKIRD
ncbi:MAG TPA: glutaredoxin family protein [Candidatus Nanoarchaeia archaeon]|nr:glutaredoxin family protein [Candidatus Nanoarchaeia archaeon]